MFIPDTGKNMLNFNIPTRLNMKNRVHAPKIETSHSFHIIMFIAMVHKYSSKMFVKELTQVCFYTFYSI